MPSRLNTRSSVGSSVTTSRSRGTVGASALRMPKIALGPIVSSPTPFDSIAVSRFSGSRAWLKNWRSTRDGKTRSRPRSTTYTMLPGRPSVMTWEYLGNSFRLPMRSSLATSSLLRSVHGCDRDSTSMAASWLRGERSMSLGTAVGAGLSGTRFAGMSQIWRSTFCSRPDSSVVSSPDRPFAFFGCFCVARYTRRRSSARASVRGETITSSASELRPSRPNFRALVFSTVDAGLRPDRRLGVDGAREGWMPSSGVDAAPPPEDASGCSEPPRSRAVRWLLLCALAE